MKYIVGAAVLAGLIGSGYFNADPVVFSPSLIDRCRMTSNDNAAIANLRTIVTAEFTYRAMTTTYGAIENLVVTGLLEERYKALVSGYRYAVTISPDGLSYVATATRESAKTGRYEYYVQDDGIVRYSHAADPSELNR